VTCQSNRLVSDIRRVLKELPDMDAHLFRLVRQIPGGRVSTYGTIARGLGDPVASRWVGRRLLHHEHSAECSCHRVVRADGSLGNYVTQKKDEKAARLGSEGIEVICEKVDLTRFIFSDFAGDRPLAQLSTLQRRMSHCIGLQPPRRTLQVAAGVDVSYRGEFGFATLVAFDMFSKQIVETVHIGKLVPFPYISSYLAFRELPLLIAVIERARQSGVPIDVLMVDGSGILHPRRCGVASMVGLAYQMPCVGVTKTLLVGKMATEPTREPAEITVDGMELGAALKPRASSKKLLYVSPGNQLDIATSVDVVRRCLTGRYLPDPIYWADRLSRQASLPR
jgi:deoxyribonuclease V